MEACPRVNFNDRSASYQASDESLRDERVTCEMEQ